MLPADDYLFACYTLACCYDPQAEARPAPEVAEDILKDMRLPAAPVLSGYDPRVIVCLTLEGR